MSFKLNFKLLIKLLIVEIIYFYGTLFILILIFFMNFGSGAGASSRKAILFGEIGIYFVVFPPILYNIFKMYYYKKTEKFKEFNSNLITGIFMIIIVIYNYYNYYLES